MTERDGGPVLVEDQELHDYLMLKEAFRMEKEALSQRGGLRQPHQRQRPIPVTPQQQAAAENGVEMFVTEGDFTRVIVWGEEGEGEEGDDDDDNESAETVQEQHQRPPQTRFTFDKKLEERERALFGAKDRSERHRCVFVVVPDRTTNTLLPIVQKYVKPGTYIFSDNWAAYHALGGSFKHFTVTHKRRFVKYLFLEDMLVLKITTNHIERLWVELRRILRGVTCERLPEKLALVPYRLMRITPGQHVENMMNFFRDLVTAGILRDLYDRGSAFRLALN